jgi:hypothetical protein
MLSGKRVQSKVVEVGETLENIGYEVNEFIGPTNSEGDPVDPEQDEELEEEDDLLYYLTCNLEGAEFYIAFSTNRKTASIIYPMDVLAYLGSQLSENEVESLVDESINWGSLSPEEEEEYGISASKTIINQTDPENYIIPAYNLSAYVSTSLIDYRQTTTEEGFPTRFQCLRLMFPYTEQVTMKSLEDRIMPVIVAGNRGKRYIEYAFRFEKEDREPQEYEFKSII